MSWARLPKRSDKKRYNRRVSREIVAREYQEKLNEDHAAFLECVEMFYDDDGYDDMLMMDFERETARDHDPYYDESPDPEEMYGYDLNYSRYNDQYWEWVEDLDF